MESQETAEQVASATVQIIADSARGSGFHFLRPEIIVTNHHVVEDAGSVTALTERGEVMELEELSFSPAHEEDYAIYRVSRGLQETRKALMPADNTSVPSRGTPVLFSGFPHGLEDLLVQSASVAGPASEDIFYIDGSVNGGNSGGPVVDESGALRGIVTQRRFLGGDDLEEMARRPKLSQFIAISFPKKQGGSASWASISVGSQAS